MRPRMQKMGLNYFGCKVSQSEPITASIKALVNIHALFLVCFQ